MKPLLGGPLTDEELAPWNRAMQGKALKYRNTFAVTYRDADRRDAELMSRLTRTRAASDPVTGAADLPFKAIVHSLMSLGLEPRA